MTGKNIKKFKIVKGEIKLFEILDKEGTFITSYGSDEVYNYKNNTIIKQNHKLTIAGALEVGVNYATLQLDHQGIKLEEITNGNKKY